MLRKAHMRFTQSSRSFPVAFETVPMFCLTDDGPLSSFLTSSFHASLLQAIDDVISLALCLQVVSETSQHFRSSEKQATCEGCFACQPAYLLGYFPSLQHVQGSTPTGIFEGGYQPLVHSSLSFPSHFSLFVASSLNL